MSQFYTTHPICYKTDMVNVSSECIICKFKRIFCVRRVPIIGLTVVILRE